MFSLFPLFWNFTVIYLSMSLVNQFCKIPDPSPLYTIGQLLLTSYWWKKISGFQISEIHLVGLLVEKFVLQFWGIISNYFNFWFLPLHFLFFQTSYYLGLKPTGQILLFSHFFSLPFYHFVFFLNFWEIFKTYFSNILLSFSFSFSLTCL